MLFTKTSHTFLCMILYLLLSSYCTAFGSRFILSLLQVHINLIQLYFFHSSFSQPFCFSFTYFPCKSNIMPSWSVCLFHSQFCIQCASFYLSLKLIMTFNLSKSCIIGQPFLNQGNSNGLMYRIYNLDPWLLRAWNLGKLWLLQCYG